MPAETIVTRVSAYGRFADDLTRSSLAPGDFEVVLDGSIQSTRVKSDGYFVLTDLVPSPASRSLRVSGYRYQSRDIAFTVPTPAPVEIAPDGEDELFVLVTAVDGTTDQASFAALPFTPTIRAGAAVFGEGGFTDVLQEDAEGSGLGFVTLGNVAGLSTGEVIRIRRSSRLILKPGPYYAFDAGSTVVAIRVVENTLGDPPIESAAMEIDRVDGNPLSPRNVGGVQVLVATLADASAHLLGPDRVIRTGSNRRGDAVFCFDGATPVASVRVQTSLAGFLPATDTIAITPGGRTSLEIRLDRA